MQFVNYTPFPPFVFQSEDVERRPFTVVVLRGSFAIEQGRPLRPVPDQEPVVRKDGYRGVVNRSSLLVESDLAPYKPRSDLHVEAVAHSPSGKPESSWLVRVQVGTLDKSLRVTGPRSFRRARRGWKLGEPEPCTDVPVSYERAYGGRQLIDGMELVDEHNPVGVGWWPADERPKAEPPDELPAPQLESPDDPVLEVGKPYRPQGLGPMARAWLPRRALAGTFDERWQRERWPALPLDFDFAHYNSAHPDLVYPGYLTGDEQVCVEGLTPAGSLRFTLPGYQLTVWLAGAGWDGVEAPCVLDTVRIDLPLGRASLTWRARVYGEELPRRVEAYLSTGEPDGDETEEHHG